jgi:hypothetical protein
MKAIVFVLSAVIALTVKSFMHDTTFAACVSILLSYHIFLAYLVLAAERQSSLSLPILPTLLTHAACLALVVCIAVGRKYIPFFGIARFFVPALATFEAAWLFSGGRMRDPVPFDGPSPSTPPARAPILEDNTEDYAEFLKQIRQGNRPYQMAGRSIHEEYNLWITARAKKQASEPPPSASSTRLFTEP